MQLQPNSAESPTSAAPAGPIKRGRKPRHLKFACPVPPRGRWKCPVCTGSVRSKRNSSWYPPGQREHRAHDGCFSTDKEDAQHAATASAAAVVAIPAVSLKRAPKPKPHFDEQQPLSALAASPPESVVTRALRSLDDGYAVFASDSSTVLRGEDGTASLGARIATTVSQMQLSGQWLHGGATQHPVHTIPAFAQHIADYRALLRTVVLPKLGFSAAAIAVLHCVDFKVLIGKPRESKAQIPHFDTGIAWDAPPSFLSCLLHCTAGPGIHTTALPKDFNAESIFSPTVPALHCIAGRVNGGYNARRMHELQTIMVPHIAASRLSSAPARIGDLTVFRQRCVPHLGTAHTGPIGAVPRVLFYCMVSTLSTPVGQDLHSYYPWQAVEHAFGRGSLQHLSSLVQWRRAVPLENQERDEDWLELFKLLKAKPTLFRRYYGERATTMEQMDDAALMRERAQSMEQGAEEIVVGAEERGADDDDGEEEQEPDMEREEPKMEWEEGDSAATTATAAAASASTAAIARLAF